MRKYARYYEGGIFIFKKGIAHMYLTTKSPSSTKIYFYPNSTCYHMTRQNSSSSPFLGQKDSVPHTKEKAYECHEQL